jgi:secondary thiamine-phosphate synthase enzyme
MAVYQKQIAIQTRGQGLIAITAEVAKILTDAKAASDGLVHLFLHHTSASLVIQENADPTARQDLEEFLRRLVPENQSWHRHLDEGPDDTVSHMKAALLPVSLQIPVHAGALGVGTWQGVYLWEHRRAPHLRKVTVTYLS